jgi:hypothetical protein
VERWRAKHCHERLAELRDKIEGTEETDSQPVTRGTAGKGDGIARVWKFRNVRQPAPGHPCRREHHLRAGTDCPSHDRRVSVTRQTSVRHKDRVYVTVRNRTDSLSHGRTHKNLVTKISQKGNCTKVFPQYLSGWGNL